MLVVYCFVMCCLLTIVCDVLCDVCCVFFGAFCLVFVFNGELAPGRLPGRGQGLHLCALSTGRPLPVRARLGRMQTIFLFLLVVWCLFSLHV